LIKFDLFKNSVSVLDNLFISYKDFSLDEEHYSEKLDYIVSYIIVKLTDGSNKISHEHIELMTTFLPSNIKDIVKKRWTGILYALNNEYTSAVECFNEALSISESNNIDDWIIRDILIDTRNIQTRNSNFLGEFFNSSEAQNKLKDMGFCEYFPVLDRRLYYSLNKYQNELFDNYTSSPNSMRFSDSSKNSVEEVTKALILAICYGSYTFINICIELLAELLFLYSKIYNSSLYVYDALKLFIIESRIPKVKKIIDSEWDLLYKKITDDPIEIIDFSVKFNNLPQNISMKCVLIEKFAQYIDDDRISDIEEFLINCISLQYSFVDSFDIKRNSLKALAKIINRINQRKVILSIIQEFDNSPHPLVEDEILNVLSKIKWENIDKHILPTILEYLKLRRGRSNHKSIIYFILYQINNIYPELLSDTIAELYNEWLETKNHDTIAFFSENITKIDSEIASDFINNIISDITSENNTYVEGSPISFKSYTLFDILPQVILLNSDKIVLGKTFEVFKNVLLNSFQTIQNKIDCIDCIIKIRDSKSPMSERYVNTIVTDIDKRFKEILTGRGDTFFGTYTLEMLELKIFELIISIKKKPKNFGYIIAKCIELSSHSLIDVRGSSLSVIRAISKHNCKAYENMIRQYFYTKTFDNWYKIRGDSLVFLSQVTKGNTQWNTICTKRMKDLVNDSNSYVRSSIIYAIKESISDGERNDDYNSIVKTMIKDTHYMIREQANDALICFKEK